MATASQILARFQQSLAIIDPTLDSSVGSPINKIFESVAQDIADVVNNNVLQSYSFDVNTKSGAALDAFVANWGIARNLGQRATGTAVFSINTSSPQNIQIPLGTQISTQGSNTLPAVYFNTTAFGMLPAGATTAEIPIMAASTGSSGNLPAYSITNMINALVGITSVTNLSGTSGGTNIETDAQLRARWQATAFRNLAGTQAQFLSTCLNNSFVSQASVLGPQTRATEQLQITIDTAVAPGVVYTVSPSSTTGTFQLSWNGITSSTYNLASLPILGSTVLSDLITKGVPADILVAGGNGIYGGPSGSFYLTFYSSIPLLIV